MRMMNRHRSQDFLKFFRETESRKWIMIALLAYGLFIYVADVVFRCLRLLRVNFKTQLSE